MNRLYRWLPAVLAVLAIILCLLPCQGFAAEDKAPSATSGKYFTLSFDDGITQDATVVEILNRYGLHCCTFYINTGKAGADESDSLSGLLGRPASYIRYSQEQLCSGVYDGFDVASHSYSHSRLSDFDSSPVKQVSEISRDVRNIRKWFGTSPVGLAWPGGEGCYTDITVERISRRTGIRYARGTACTGTFNPPEDFMRWMPTMSVSDMNLLDKAQEFIASEADGVQLFYIYGHSFELDSPDVLERFEALIALISESVESGDVIPVTNTEFFYLYQ